MRVPMSMPTQVQTFVVTYPIVIYYASPICASITFLATHYYIPTTKCCFLIISEKYSANAYAQHPAYAYANEFAYGYASAYSHPLAYAYACPKCITELASLLCPAINFANSHRVAIAQFETLLTMYVSV